MMNAYLSIFFNLRYQAKNTPSEREGVFFCYNQAKTPVAHFKLTQLASCPSLCAACIAESLLCGEVVPAAFSCKKNHHECLVGQGYPYGNKLEEIPLSSRIISVCDSIISIVSEQWETLLRAEQ